MLKSICISIFLLLFISCNNSNKPSNHITSDEKMEMPKSNDTLSTAKVLAYKNGYENWYNVSELKFTFNVDRGDKHVQRAWIWKPKTQEVVMMSGKDTVRYNRTKMDSIGTKTDAVFINDQFWLLAPFNLIWDDGISFTEKHNIIAPISKDTLSLLTATYEKDGGGYTPGDAYDFYYSKDFMIKEWTYRQGNSATPSMSTTWEDYENYNGLKLAKSHKDANGTFKLYFTNISIKK